MMTAALVSVEEYLSTDYSPDCDYVDGVLEDRNVGQKDHSTAQQRTSIHQSAISMHRDPITDDRMSRMQEKIRDYLRMGVPYVWLVDPYTRLAWTYTSEGAVEVKDGILRTSNPQIEMPLAEILPA